MLTPRYLLSLLPFGERDTPGKRQIEGTAMSSSAIETSAAPSGPLYAPLQPTTTRCYAAGTCVEFAYPAVILESNDDVLQVVCPSDNRIIITFDDHTAFVTAQRWPIANLVLVGQGYPGCGPSGAGEDERFYAITESTRANARSRSITARVTYVSGDQVILSESPGATPSVITTTLVQAETITISGTVTTIYSTTTDLITIYPTYVPPESSEGPSSVPSSPLATDTSSDSPSSSFPSPVTSASTVVESPAPTSSCLVDGGGFSTDSTGITYEGTCNYWTNGDTIGSFGPDYTAEQCLETCSMIFPGCAAAVFTSLEGGYCSLLGPGDTQSRIFFGYDTYRRVTMHVGKNTSGEATMFESTAASTAPSLSPPTEDLSLSPVLPTLIESPTSSPIQTSSAADVSTSEDPVSLPSAESNISIAITTSSEAEEASSVELITTGTSIPPDITSPESSIAGPLQTPPVDSPCPAYDESTYTDANGRSYEVYCGRNLSASFLSAMYYLDEDEDCMELCDQTDGCVGAARITAWFEACLMYGRVDGIGASDPQSNAFVLTRAVSSSVPTSSIASSTSRAPETPSASEVNCPASNQEIFVDPEDQRSYQINCESLLHSPGTSHYTQFRNIRGGYSFVACAAFCDEPICPGFVYSGRSSACGVYNASVDSARSAVPSQATAVTLAWANYLTPTSTSASEVAEQTSIVAESSTSSEILTSSLPEISSEAESTSEPASVEPTTSESSTTVLSSGSSESSQAELTNQDSATLESSSREVASSTDSSISTVATTSSEPTPRSVCPAFSDRTFTDNGGVGYSVTCNYDMPGGDFNSPLITPVYGLNTDQECLALCDETPGCVGVVFASISCRNNWCHCFLKDYIPPYNYNPNYNSYIRISGPGLDNISSSAVPERTSAPPSSFEPQESTFVTSVAPDTSTFDIESSSFASERTSEAIPDVSSTSQDTSPRSISSDARSSITLEPTTDEVSSSLEVTPTTEPSPSIPREAQEITSSEEILPSSEASSSQGFEQTSSVQLSANPASDFILSVTPTPSTPITAPSISLEETLTSTPTSLPTVTFPVAPSGLPCPASDNTFYTPANSSSRYQLGCNQDLLGAGQFNGRSIQPSFQTCIDSCDAMDPGSCWGVSWVPQGQERTWCWYKLPEDDFTPEPYGVTVYSAKLISGV